MPKAQIKGIDLCYEVHGQGPAVVFAHGAGGNHVSWWQQVPLLARQYRCISFDHRGFGQFLDVPHGPGSSALVMADTTGGFSDARMAQLRAEGEAALAGANPPPRTYARHFPQEQPAPAFLYEQVRALRRPTLLIVGEHDVIAPPALMKIFQSYIPHARLAEVAGAGHSVYFEKPAEFNRLVLEFFTEVGV
jgi:3-oxoadipate enol-lactonase